MRSDLETGSRPIAPDTVIFGRYRVLSLLGAGASGTVYKCIDTLLGNVAIALKLFPAHVLQDEAACARLPREIISLHAIDHHNVARFYEFHSDEKHIGFSMEFIEGENLSEFISRGSPLKFATIFSMLIQLASGLQAIHRLGIIHRDIKPANVLITVGGIPKITDFGLAQTEAEGSTIGRPTIRAGLKSSRATMSGTAVGTPAYISPEYIAEGTLDARSDLYSLGVIAFEMVTGRLPINSLSVDELLRMKISNEPPAAQSLRPECPEMLNELIGRALHRDPARRFQSAAEMLTSIKAAREDWLSSAKADELHEYRHDDAYNETSTEPAADDQVRSEKITWDDTAEQATSRFGRIELFAIATGILWLALLAYGALWLLHRSASLGN